MTKNALIYARVSHDPQQQGRSVESQVADCQDWAEREGWTVVDTVRDVDRSASRHARKKREGWAEVQRQVSAGGVDVVVMWEASRAQRDLSAYTELRTLCERSGAKLAYSGTVYDLTDRTDRFRTGLDALVAEDEADRISERVCRGVRSAAMEGRPTGRKLYGYRRLYDETTGNLIGQEPDPEQAAIVSEVARRFLAGESLRSLWRELNAREVPTPTGKGDWGHRQVSRLVSNPAYAGLRVHRGEVVGDAAWEPIHDAETWARLKAKLSDPSRVTTRNRATVHLLTGIARCGVCGVGLKYGNDGDRKQYQCRQAGYHVARDKNHLDAYVVGVVLERLSQPDVWAVMDDGPDPDVLDARAEVGRLRQRLDEAAAQFVAGKLSAELLSQVEGQLKAEMAEAEKRATYAGLPSTVTELAQGDAAAVWDEMTVEQRREVLRSLLSVRVDRVARRGLKGFDPASVTIEWKR